MFQDSVMEQVEEVDPPDTSRACEQNFRGAQEVSLAEALGPEWEAASQITVRQHK